MCFVQICLNDPTKLLLLSLALALATAVVCTSSRCVAFDGEERCRFCKNLVAVLHSMWIKKFTHLKGFICCATLSKSHLTFLLPQFTLANVIKNHQLENIVRSTFINKRLTDKRCCNASERLESH